MTISALKRNADAKEYRRQGERAFTMVEIALAIGVIAFALVAIIGILPRGMTMQRNEKQDTAISEDARYFIDAIRNGAGGTNGMLPTNSPLSPYGGFGHAMDFLTNYVQAIYFCTNGTKIGQLYPNTLTMNPFTPGAEILGLLSTPNPTNYGTNYFTSTRAIVRALNSPATEQNGNSAFTGLLYQMDVEIFPFNKFPNNTTYQSPTYYLENNVNPNVAGSGALTYNLYDVRLHFRWPVLNWQGPGKAYNLGEGYQDYRTMIAGELVETNIANQTGALLDADANNANNWWFFMPDYFTNYSPGGLQSIY